MNISEIKKHLKPWIQMDTWNSAHPLDTRRFNKALKNAIDTAGGRIDSGDIEEAILQLIGELYPNYTDEAKEEAANRFATRAEHILDYLSDNR